MMPVKGFFFQVLLLSIISLTASLFTVRRMGEGDWFEGTGNIKCDELSAYMDSSGHGCRCRYGKTLSTEKLTCITYQERGEYIRSLRSSPTQGCYRVLVTSTWRSY